MILSTTSLQRCELVDLLFLNRHTPVPSSERGQKLLAFLGLRLVRQDPGHLLLDLPGQEQPAVVEHPHLEVAALVEDGDVLALVHVLNGVWWRRQERQQVGRRKTWRESRKV